MVFVVAVSVVVPVLVLVLVVVVVVVWVVGSMLPSYGAACATRIRPCLVMTVATEPVHHVVALRRDLRQRGVRLNHH